MAAPSPPNDPSTDPSVQDLIALRPWLKHDAMDGLLLDGVPLAGIADTVGTPTWVYSAATMRARYKTLTGAMSGAGLDMQVHFAVKANDSRAVLSPEPEASVVPSGEKATLFTSPLWPSSTWGAAGPGGREGGRG